MNTASAPTTRSIRNFRILMAGLVAASVMLAAGCSATGTKAAEKASSKKVVASTKVLPDSTTVVAGDASAPIADQTTAPSNDTPSAPAPTSPSDGGSSAGSSSGSSGTPVPTPSGPAPVISSFSTPEDIDCHNGNFQEFTASWTTAHADKVTISIDGPGVYKTYGPNGEDSLPFNCSTAHTFLLKAYGNGQVASKSITLQPRNVQDLPEDEMGDGIDEQ